MPLGPKQLSIFSRISLNAELMDTRNGRYGLKFGTVQHICKQYGIKYKEHKDRTEFYGPRDRMNHFIEKLHFSRISYSY